MSYLACGLVTHTGSCYHSCPYCHSSFAVKTYAQNIYAMGHIFTLPTNRHNTFSQVLRHIISSFLRHIYVEITERSRTVSLTSFPQEQRSIPTFLRKYP